MLEEGRGVLDTHLSKGIVKPAHQLSMACSVSSHISGGDGTLFMRTRIRIFKAGADQIANCSHGVKVPDEKCACQACYLGQIAEQYCAK